MLFFGSSELREAWTVLLNPVCGISSGPGPGDQAAFLGQQLLRSSRQECDVTFLLIKFQTAT